MPRKSTSIDSMKSADGQNVQTQPFGGARSIAEILGTRTHKYRTTNAEQYKAEINKMSRADLQAHAYDLGILPVDSRAQLVDRLMKEFAQQTSGFKAAAVRHDGNEALLKDPEMHQKVKDILSRGR